MKTTQGRCNTKIYEKQKKIPDKRLNQKKRDRTLGGECRINQSTEEANRMEKVL